MKQLAWSPRIICIVIELIRRLYKSSSHDNIYGVPALADESHATKRVMCMMLCHLYPDRLDPSTLKAWVACR